MGQRKIRVGEQGGEQVGQHAPLGGFCAIGIIRLLPHMLHPGIHQHIAGAGVEAESRCIVRQHADVGNAADVEHHAGFVRAVKKRLVKRRHQRRTLATAGQIAAAKIANGENAAQFGQARPIGQLDAVARFGRMAHGLAVAADGGNVGRR